MGLGSLFQGTTLEKEAFSRQLSAKTKGFPKHTIFLRLEAGLSRMVSFVWLTAESL
jgi:hypothetical protein